MGTEVWYAQTDALEKFLDEPSEWDFLWEWRKERIRRCKRKEDKLRALCAGLLLYRGLFARCGFVLPEGAFSFGRNGKPELCAGVGDVFFNVSHAGNYAAAVFSDTEAGIDVERDRVGGRKVAERFFTERERKYLAEKNWDGGEFTRLWTRKESYVKATGEGVAAAFDGFCALDDKIGDYIVESRALPGGAYLSVCVKGGGSTVFREAKFFAPNMRSRTKREME